MALMLEPESSFLIWTLPEDLSSVNHNPKKKKNNMILKT